MWPLNKTYLEFSVNDEDGEEMIILGKSDYYGCCSIPPLVFEKANGRNIFVHIRRTK